MRQEMVKYVHICEVCGKREVLTSQEAFDRGWDYPPIMGAFGIVSPRTCGECVISDTLWFTLQSGKIRDLSELDEHQKTVLERILNEPESIVP